MALTGPYTRYYDDGFDRTGYNEDHVDRDGFNQSGEKYVDGKLVAIDLKRYRRQILYNYDNSEPSGYHSMFFSLDALMGRTDETFNLFGYHPQTGTKFDPQGYDEHGLDEDGYTIDGIDKNLVMHLDVKHRKFMELYEKSQTDPEQVETIFATTAEGFSPYEPNAFSSSNPAVIVVKKGKSRSRRKFWKDCWNDSL